MQDRTTDIAGSVSRSVVITGDGNTVRLTFGDGGVVLGLERRHVRRPDRQRQVRAGESARELDLLDPERGTLPFVGRADMMGVLRDWAESDVDVSILAVTGRAGSGKTRLALALCEALDPEGGSGGGEGTWRAGFLSGSSLAAVVEALATRTFGWAGDLRVLVVVDNAAQCHRAMAGWLDWLVHERLGEARLRVLLLEREAPEGFGWWHDLAGGARRGELFHALRPVGLPELADVEERRALLGAALAGAARVRGVSVAGGVPAAGEQPGVDRALAGTQFGSPLNLVMAGVLALDQGLGAALALRRLDAAQRLGARELERFERMAEAAGVGVDAMRHAVGFNALAGGLAVDGLPGVLAGELAGAHLAAGGAAGLASLLEQELPPRRVGGGAARLGGVRPDLVGEAVTIAAFSGQAWREAEGAKALARAYAIEPDRAAAALMRLVQDFGYAMEDPASSAAEKAVGGRVMEWLRTLVDGVEDAWALASIADAFPVHGLVLREIAAEVQGRVADAFGRRAEQSGEVSDAVLVALALNNLANRLRALGRREAALEAAQQAVDLYRILVAKHPGAHTSSLAMSLHNLATMLGGLGHEEAALEAAQQAVDLRRTLAEARPDVFTPDLAMSLNNLGNRLSQLGRREAALEAAQQAVDLYRAVTAEHPDAFTPDLAMSLDNLAPKLGNLGHWEVALAVVREAVDLYRTMAASRPDAFMPALAGSLHNLSNILGNLGHREAALDAVQQALDLHQALAAARPEVFASGLAASFHTLANRLSDLGRLEAALEAAQQAVDLDRALAAARPDVFTSGLAASLSNLTNRLGALGRQEEALEAAQQALELYRALSVVRPDAFASDLARAHINLACRLSDLGHRENALEAAQQSVELYRTMAAARPEAFTPEFAGSLHNLANMLSDLGRREEALEAAQQAVELRRALAASRGDVLTPYLAGSLSNLAARLSALGQEEAALAAGQEAVDLRRALAAARPDTFTPDLAGSLWIFGDLLAGGGQTQRGIATLEEAIVLLKPAAFLRPAAFRDLMRGILGSYLTRCDEAGIVPDSALLRSLLPHTDENGEMT